MNFWKKLKKQKDNIIEPQINNELTLKEFGQSPDSTPGYKLLGVITDCVFCGKSRKLSHKSFLNLKRNPTKCRHCPEYKKERSDIAAKSNSNRKLRDSLYDPYLEDIISGNLTFLELSRTLGKDDSTVCKWFHKNRNAKSKHGNKSLQEDAVYSNLKIIFPDIARHVRYSKDTRHVADFWESNLGFIEYDGSGFYHQNKDSDHAIDTSHNPIRLNAQAYYGGTEYLLWLLKGEKSGYCGVSSPKEYSVRKLEKISPANEMLENCHILKSTAGKDVYGLYFKDKLIGVAKFGSSTNPKDNDKLELRRFFVLDGTPRNSESWFLDKCLKLLPKNKSLVTYIHSHEKGSYLKALNWKIEPNLKKDYDFYIIKGKIVSKRTIWGWAKKIGLVDKIGTTKSKEVLCKALGGTKITEPSKIKFIYNWNNNNVY